MSLAIHAWLAIGSIAWAQAAAGAAAWAGQAEALVPAAPLPAALAVLAGPLLAALEVLLLAGPSWRTDDQVIIVHEREHERKYLPSSCAHSLADLVTLREAVAPRWAELP